MEHARPIAAAPPAPLHREVSASEVPPLVGREREVERLRHTLTVRTHTGPWLLEITGEPGAGKTGLLTEWTGQAERAGVAVLSGRASGPDRHRPFAAFAAPVAKALGFPDAFSGLTPADRALLLRHFPEAGPSGVPRAPGPEGAERDQLLEAIAELLSAAGHRRRLAVCLDDLQWADDASLDLLIHLLRRPRPRTPLILVCSVRPGQGSPGLMASLADPHDAYRVERVALGPLPRSAAGELFGPGTTADRQRLLYEAGGGNPFYMRVLSLSPGPLMPPGGTTPWVLSDEAATVAATAIARELTLLDAEEHEILRAATVLGEEFDPAHLAYLADRAQTVTAKALDRLIALDLIRADHTHGRSCRLRHPVLRAVVYQRAPHSWRRDAHARADRILRKTGAGPVERAPHVARSATTGDHDAVRLLMAASEQVRWSEPTAAASWLSTALSLVRGDGDGLRLPLMKSLAQSLGTIGRLRECQELLRRIPRPAGLPRTRDNVELVAFQAMMERHLGNYREAEALLEAELAELAELPLAPEDHAALSAPLRLELATVSLLRRAFPRSRSLAEEALRQAPAGEDRHNRAADTAHTAESARTADTAHTGNPYRTTAPVDPPYPVRMAAMVCLTHCAAFEGEVPVLLRSAREAGALVDSIADAELTPHLDTLSQLGWAEALAELHHDALRHMARGIRLAHASGQLFILPYLRLAHAYASVSVGRLTDAVRSAEGAEEDARWMKRPALLGFALALRAWATSLLDGPGAASPIAERAVQELGAGGRLWAVTAGVLADVRLAQERPVDCLELTRSATEHTRHPGTARCIRPIWYALGARAAAALGDRGAAADWARRATADADLLGLPGQRGFAALARAHSVLDPVGPLHEAVVGFSAGGLVLMECQARLLLARTLLSREAYDKALEQAKRAKNLAAASGARRLYREAVDIQRRLGAHQPRSVRERESPLPEMSVREREIARMVTLGMSNSDIARALVVSPKTVEAHLTRIFRKVGVRSRVALVTALRPQTGQESPA
ncbi:AAA family ATPase [Streptomyces sp. HUAS ZL42]|uniref:helix-turn-helix transcriptional regulator n=1 Tax=Streptomyces sp. HUAS ZL42 TaxID=3231715 RepID=UPI00345E3392